MNIDELQKEFCHKTTLQKQELLKKLIGTDVGIIGYILNIEYTRISLHNIPDNYDLIGGVYNSLDCITVIYDDGKFKDILLSYQRYDDVEIRASLLDWSIKGIDHFSFELVSISKIGTNEISRHEAYIKSRENSCFIATMCYGDFNSPEVVVLRQFRDNTLLKSMVGRLFVKVYYTLGPVLAKLISKSESVKYYVRTYFLAPVVFIIRTKQKD